MEIRNRHQLSTCSRRNTFLSLMEKIQKPVYALKENVQMIMTGLGAAATYYSSMTAVKWNRGGLIFS